ncbi:hypothetical protein COE51_12920 [Bacillus pseudomycoides]|nr:hypothetical protein COE51_12920 [Bacillus pseudomycoides]
MKKPPQRSRLCDSFLETKKKELEKHKNANGSEMVQKLNFQKNITLIGCFFLLFLYDYEFITKNKINQRKIDNFL